MGLKKRNKVNPEFSMSSLTDIIFLLLIFFMLTSSMVIPNALNLKLPGKSNSNPPPHDYRPAVVKIASSGTYTWNGSPAQYRTISKNIRAIKKENPKKATVVIAPDPNSPNESVVAILDLAYQFQIEAIITDPK